MCVRVIGDGVVGREEVDVDADLAWTEWKRESGDWVVELYGICGGGGVVGGAGTAAHDSGEAAAAAAEAEDVEVEVVEVPSVVATTFSLLSSVRNVWHSCCF